MEPGTPCVLMDGTLLGMKQMLSVEHGAINNIMMVRTFLFFSSLSNDYYNSICFDKLWSGKELNPTTEHSLF